MIRSAAWAAFLILPIGARADDAAEARSIASQWIAAGAKMRSIEADFVQERRLRALKKPLVRPGKLWHEKPGSFRWQIGEPPVIIAARKNGGDLLAAEVREKKLTVWPREALAAEMTGGGLGMLSASFPASIEAFERAFEILSAQETAEAGVWELRLALRDRRARLAVQQITFTIVPADGSLRQFEARMRDGSATLTRITAVKRDQPADDSLFTLDSAGYSIVQGRGP